MLLMEYVLVCNHFMLDNYLIRRILSQSRNGECIMHYLFILNACNILHHDNIENAMFFISVNTDGEIDVAI